MIDTHAELYTHNDLQTNSLRNFLWLFVPPSASDPEDDYDQPPLEEGLGIPQQPSEYSFSLSLNIILSVVTL